MRKILTCLLVICFAHFDCYSQSIITTFTEDVVMDDGYSFSKGDEVVVLGYGKNAINYYFAICNNNYVARFSHPRIPFELSEKALKKLPDALHVSIFDIMREKQDEIRSNNRDRMLNDGIKAVVRNHFGSGTINDYFNIGDTVRLVGFNKSQNNYSFAILSDKICGVFSSDNYPFDIPEGIANVLPETTDIDVSNIIDLKNKEIKNAIKEKALKGEIKVVVTKESLLFPLFDDGDTVSVFGYKNNGTDIEYMLASKTKAKKANYSIIRKALLEKSLVANMPSTDDDEVILAFNNKAKELDALAEEMERIKAAIVVRHKEQQDSISRQLVANGYHLSLNRIYFTMNSVGKISPSFSFHNNSKKAIKYLDFSVYFKNAVNDVVYNEIDRKQRNLLLRDTGPVEYGNDSSGTWTDTSFYAPTAVQMLFNSMKITYMDGTVVNMNPNKLNEQIK